MRSAGIKYRQHQLRPRHFRHGALHTDLFYGVVALAKPRGVHQPQRYTAQRHGFTQDIPRGARHVGHNGGVPPDQRVIQRRFARIDGAADDGADSLTHRAPGAPGGRKPGNGVFQVAQL